MIKQITKEKVDPLTGCRKIIIKLHDPKHDKAWCINCGHYSEPRIDKKCNCCEHIMKRIKNNSWLRKVMNEGFRHNEKQIIEWISFPEKVTQDIRIFYRGIVYEVPIKYLAMSQEPIQPDMLFKTIRKKTVVKGFYEDK